MSLLLELPSEVLVLILERLSFPSLANMRLVHPLFRDLSSSQSVWRSMVCDKVFSPLEECVDGDWHSRFGQLLHAAPCAGEYQIFLSLDDLPVVRRTMGVAQVFVLSLALQEYDWKRLLSGRARCLAQRAPGDAPWGSFDTVCVSWGSLLAVFSFYAHSDIHSIYLGTLGANDSAMGCMHRQVLGEGVLFCSDRLLQRMERRDGLVLVSARASLSAQRARQCLGRRLLRLSSGARRGSARRRRGGRLVAAAPPPPVRRRRR